jgi:hypothetical protein
MEFEKKNWYKGVLVCNNSSLSDRTAEITAARISSSSLAATTQCGCRN